MSAQYFLIDDLRYYAWAFFQFGHDIRDLVPNAGKVPQMDLGTIDGKLEEILSMDADHQRKYWLQQDRALEAVGILESDGFDIGTGGKINSSEYTSAEKRMKKNAFINFIRPNIERYKAEMRKGNVSFEAVPANPERDYQAIEGLNRYTEKILNYNNFKAHHNDFVHDMVSYGSGVLEIEYDEQRSAPDEHFFKKQIDQVGFLSFDEFYRFLRVINCHKISYCNTFEFIRCRYSSGPDDRSLSTQPYYHRVRQKRVSELRLEFPDFADRINPNMHRHAEMNPKTSLSKNDEETATLKETFIRFPVSYQKQLPIRHENHIFQARLQRNRYAYAKIQRIEGVGVVGMTIDEYAHRGPIHIQGVFYPSFKHACGIGNVKFGREPLKVHNIMYNGKLRFIQRMAKGGGYYIKGIVDENTIEQQTTENAWIGVDPKKLPAEWSRRPLNDLIEDKRPTQFPNIWSEMEIQAQRYVDDTMSIPDAVKGIRQGNSGRQQMMLEQQANQVMSGGIEALEKVHFELGNALHSNIVQFDSTDADGYPKEFSFYYETPGDNSPRRIDMNMIEDYFIQYEEGVDDYKLYPIAIRNNLLTMQFTTQMATRSLIPRDPTERRLYMQEMITQLAPWMENPIHRRMVRYFVQYGLGGLPGFEDFMADVEELQQQMMEAQREDAEQDRQRDQWKAEREQDNKAAELAQNDKRLDQNFVTKMKEIMAKAQEQTTQ